VNNLVPTTSIGGVGEKVKSFWSRKEGKYGGTILLLIFGATVAGALIKYDILNKLAKISWDFVSFGIALVTSAVILFLLTSKNVHFLFRALAWQITDKCITKLDPKSRLEMLMNDGQKNIDEVDKNIGLVSGAKETVSNSMALNETEIRNRESQLRQGAKEGLNENDVTMQSLASERDELVAANKEYLGVYDLLADMETTLNKALDYARYLHRTAAFRLKILLQKRTTMAGVGKAVASAKNVIYGGTNAQQFQNAWNQIVDETDRNMGDFKQFLRQTAPLLTSMDLAKRASVQEALERIRSKDMPDVKQLPAAEEPFNLGETAFPRERVSVLHRNGR
jgi:hypothetical protein